MNCNKCALVCIAKNEDNYIKQWTDYHLKLGFSDIYVYQNNWRTTVLKETDNIHLKIIDGDLKQLDCYNQAIDELYKTYKWIAFFDVDEFLVIKRDPFNISQFLSQNIYMNIPCICVNWRIFGDSNIKYVNTYDVLNRFIYCDDKLEESSKVILHTEVTFNTVKFYYNPHCINSYQFDPNLKFQLKCVGNNKHINDDSNVEPLELNHYCNKTYAEYFIRHFNQSSAWSYSDNFLNNFNCFNDRFKMYNKNIIKNTIAKDFFNG